jgi:hypothetical protein
MAFTLLPIPPADSTAAAAAPFLLQLNGSPAFDKSSTSEKWTRQILRWRNEGLLPLHVALFLQRYILMQLGYVSLAAQWANLVVVEVLGQVDTTPLTEICLRYLIQNADSMHYQVHSKGIKTASELQRYTDSRKAAGKALCGGTQAAYLTFFDRVRDALVPLLSL